MLVAFLRCCARDWMDGLHSARDILLWGQAYPRRVSLADLQRTSRDRSGDICSPGSG